MKKLLLVLLSALLLTLCGCEKTYTAPDGLIERARQEIDLVDIETMEVRIGGIAEVSVVVTGDRTDKCLVWFITGNEYQAHGYYPMEFEHSDWDPDQHRFVRAYKSLDRGTDIAVLQWQRGYSFLINNPKCVTLELMADGEKVVIDVDAVPFQYFHPSMPREYRFLDAQGQEIY